MILVLAIIGIPLALVVIFSATKWEYSVQRSIYVGLVLVAYTAMLFTSAFMISGTQENWSLWQYLQNLPFLVLIPAYVIKQIGDVMLKNRPSGTLEKHNSSHS